VLDCSKHNTPLFYYYSVEHFNQLVFVIVADWNKDWKPGPFPKTAEERAAAAKRYGLRVEDYDVYANDGMGYGDYPKLPFASGDSRDPYEDWDIPEQKRNYGEPVSD
jgi:NADH dehydrogenase (ubiquinone) 1 beta subcomplex subunit 8